MSALALMGGGCPDEQGADMEGRIEKKVDHIDAQQNEMRVIVARIDEKLDNLGSVRKTAELNKLAVELIKSQVNDMRRVLFLAINVGLGTVCAIIASVITWFITR